VRLIDTGFLQYAFGGKMKFHQFANSYLMVFVAAVFMVSSAAAQQMETPSSDGSFWVNFWAKPRPMLNGPEEEAFYQNVKDVLFASNNDDRPVNPDALAENARWLKEHANVRFHIDGYASLRGSTDYNLALSKRRAEWVKRALISRGIPENRIVLAVGWGELYPACLSDSLDCRAKNRLVRFTYVKN
jgi:outer membrane protein OmpA-like peptidoglycan-associated protein